MNAYWKRWERMYGRKVMMLAAPGVGLLKGTATRNARVLLEDRKANGLAFPGEFVVRVPIQAWGRWATQRPTL